MRNKKLIIIGAGGHGKVVADIALSMKNWDGVYFIDDNEFMKEQIGLSIIGCTEDIPRYINDFDIITAIGDNKIRRDMHLRLKKLGAVIPTLIHPSAIVGLDVNIGSGSVVMAGCIINCCTKIGEACIINTGCIIEHDNKISDYVHISPGTTLSGTVEIGENTWIGSRSVISNNISITNNCIIGAGSVVIRDIKYSGVYVGVPIRRL